MKTKIKNILIGILLITTVIACNQKAPKKQVSVENDLIGDYWVEAYNDTLLHYNNRNELWFDGGYYRFINNNTIEVGYISYEEADQKYNRKEKFDVKKYDDFTFIEVDIDNLNFKDGDGLLYLIKIIDYNKIVISVAEDESFSQTLVRIPKFFPKKPIAYLKEKKEELDLGLITEAEYESLLQKTKKYIEY